MPTKDRGTITPRNPVVRSPLMRKGGVHEKGKTAKRQQNDWREEVEFERSLRSNSDFKNLSKTVGLMSGI